VRCSNQPPLYTTTAGWGQKQRSARCVNTGPIRTGERELADHQIRLVKGDPAMQSTAQRLPARREMTLTRLLDAPLDDLLVELEVQLHLSAITDPEFIGALVQRHDGSLILSMPPGRPRLERDCVARALLGEVLGVPLAPLPEPYELTEV
jgi:hypothetical protein